MEPRRRKGRPLVLKHEVSELRIVKARRSISGDQFLCCYIALLGPDSHDDLDAIKGLCARVIAGLQRLANDAPLRNRILARAAGHVFQDDLDAQLLLDRAAQL